MSKRAVITVSKDWVHQVQAGIPFVLTDNQESPSISMPPKERVRVRSKDSLSHRTIRQLGTLWRVEEVAEYTKVSRSTVYDWIYQGRLKKTMVGGQIRIAQPDLEEFIGA